MSTHPIRHPITHPNHTSHPPLSTSPPSAITYPPPLGIPLLVQAMRDHVSAKRPGVKILDKYALDPEDPILQPLNGDISVYIVAVLDCIAKVAMTASLLLFFCFFSSFLLICIIYCDRMHLSPLIPSLSSQLSLNHLNQPTIP